MGCEMRLDDLQDERKALCELRERIAQQVEGMEGAHRELDALQNQLSELTDMIELNDRQTRFVRGEGVLITLRVMPMPWHDDDPHTWNWQELLDLDTVAVVS